MKWGAQKIGIEINAYQKALALLVKGATPYIPVHEIRTSKDKTQRAMVLSAYTERHELHLCHTMTDVMETLVQMPNPESGHDDDFDAIDFAVETVKTEVLAGTVVGRVNAKKVRRR
jgi:predicted phage terminase large subunit-like protein